MQLSFVDPLLLAGMEHNAALPLVGRESEMQIVLIILNNVLQDAPAGPRALNIRGDMGVGKSRLLAEVYAEAQALGFRVIEGRVYEAENRFPYFPFVEALRPVLRALSREQLQHYLGSKESAGVEQAQSADQRAQEIGQTQETEQAQGTAPTGVGMGSEIIPLTGEPFIAALAHLFPEIPGRLNMVLAQEDLTPMQQKFRIFDAVATLLERMSVDQPVVMSIDNLQWADSASLELTVYLTMRLRQSRVALLGATRPPNLGNDTSQEFNDVFATPAAAMQAMRVLGELMRQGLLMVVPLMPLQSAGAEQHLQQLLPGEHVPELAQVLLSRAEGNPFFLEELVRALTLNQQITWNETQWQATKAIETALPTSITVAIKDRLQRLSGPCRELLRVAAHFGRTFPLEALLAVLHERGIAGNLEEAIDAQVVILVIQDAVNVGSDDVMNMFSQTYMFSQGIVQEVLYTEIPVQQVQALHRSIGKALEKTYAHDLLPHVVELARHAVLGGDKAAALHWSILAGNEAVRQQAYREGISHLRLALRLLEAGETSSAAPPQQQLAMTIGELWFKLGEFEEAERAFLHVLDLLQAVSSATPLQIAQANRYLADVYRLQSNYDQALRYLEVAQAVLKGEQVHLPVSEDVPDADSVFPWLLGRFGRGHTPLPRERGQSTSMKRVDVRERILLLQSQAMLDIFLNHAKSSESALWQSHQLATMIGDRSSQAFALHLVGYLRGWGEHIEAAIQLLEEALRIHVAIGDPLYAVGGEQVLGLVYLAVGEVEQARMYTERGFERARRYGVFVQLGWLHLNLSLIALAQGHWSECSEHLQEADNSQITRLAPLVLQARALLAFRQGDWQQAEHYFRDGVQTVAQTEWYPGALALYGHFLAVTGNHSAARTLLDKAANSPEPPGYGGDYYIPYLAEGYVHIGDAKRAKAYTERLRAQRGFMYYGLAVDRVLGVVAALSEDWVIAEQAFEDGLALCRHAKNEPEAATILYEMARVVLMRSRKEAGEVKQETLSLVQQLCNQARELFFQYDMQRYIVLVEKLQAGITQLSQPDSTIAGSGQGIEQAHRDSALHPSGGKPQSLQIPTEAASSGYSLHLHLTQRELEVLRLVAEGHTDREVADTLVISPRTVNRHLSNIFVKLNVPGRAAAVAYAIRQSLV
jgi:DNA-binding CsgD family transcriptional regulator/tetratricopeptide (TPR) repeat protein